MILTDLIKQVVYRMHVPKHAAYPTSGAGAGSHGGRANRPGVQALYLSLDVATAVKEYQQLSSLMPPGTLVNYEATVDRIVDFRSGYQASHWEPLWEDFHCKWRDLWFNHHIEPPSWIVGDLVIKAGGKGILFQSEANPGGINLVLYTDMLTTTDSIAVFDPNHDLPKNQDSWK